MDHDAALHALLAGEGRELPIGVVAGRVAECLPAGPDLAGWLATATASELEDGALAGVAASWRRLASWAAAGELAAIAQIASRSAARDEKIGVDAQGRPARIPAEAAAQVSLGLVMSQYGASWWLDLAVTLAWRLAATGAALATGTIDLYRARLIAEATARLSDDAARAVEEQILPSAGELTSAGLRIALRRAVIAADPEGAERRRKESEAQAKVCLYPDEDNTATLSGYRLPVIRAAAAMARIRAMARALKASGAAGGIDLLSAQIYLGLLCGTMPLIPPAEGAPPDNPPPDDEPPPRQPSPRGQGQTPPPEDRRPEQVPPPEDRRPEQVPPPEDPVPEDSPAEDSPAEDALPEDRVPDEPPPKDWVPEDLVPDEPPFEDAPPEDWVPEDLVPDEPPFEDAPPEDWVPEDVLLEEPPPGDAPPGEPPPGQVPLPKEPFPEDLGPPDDPVAGSLALAGLGGEEWWRGGEPGPVPDWPVLPALVPAAYTAPRPSGSPPLPGLLDLTLPWTTMAGLSHEPGSLGRVGAITPSQACLLAGQASNDPGTDWRVIVTSPVGQALAVTRIPRTRTGPALAPAGPALAPAGSAPTQAGRGGQRAGPFSTWTGLVGRVTLTIPEDVLAATAVPETAAGPGILASTLNAAAAAAERAAAQAAADLAAGGCAHTAASPAYRPPPRLREYITARDLTCRFPYCRQPAWRGDLDHTRPYQDGGLTCRCNLGGLCRFHHILKQHPDWQLTQLSPGIFQWTTPSGRTYLATPDFHLV